MSKIIYGRGRFPIQPGEKLCRGCHGPVPKGRRSWCSDACFNLFDPGRVRFFCQQRDNTVCYLCGINTKRERDRFMRANKYPEVNQYCYFRNGVFERERFRSAQAIRTRHAFAVNKARLARVAAMRAKGWPGLWRDWWEMDHIVPFSEGGLTVLENVRSLCFLCHKKRTKEWREQRALLKELAGK